MQIAILILSIVFIAGTFAPMIPSRHWIVRCHIYLRSTYFLMNCLLFILAALIFPFSILKVGLLIFLAISIVFAFKSIYPFTLLSKTTLKKARKTNPEEGIKMFIFNVYQFNEKYQKCLDKIAEIDPDIIFLVEVNDNWYAALSVLESKYPYILKEIRNDTYGLICFSKIPFEEGKVKHIISPKIPSIEFLIKIKNQSIRIFGVHPEPPSPSEATYSTKKDRELLKVAQQISTIDNSEEAILIGDFNDVAWSRITTEIKRKTNLVDPREGRGFYSTFPTYSPFKIPLDHILCSDAFEVVNFKVLENIGSDHYPVFIHLQLK